MIGMTGKDAGRAIELLHQHRSGEQMWPGRRSESEQQIRFAALLFRMTVCCAQDEARLPHPVIAPTPQQFGEIFRGHRLAAFIQQHGFAGRLGFRDAAAGFRQFGKLEGPRNSLLVARDELRLR